MSRRRLGAHPYLLGYEHVDDLLERAERIASNAGPPYNIAVCGPDRYSVILAVPGFAEAQLEVVAEPGGLLVVRGRPVTLRPEHVFIHHGIAAKPFTRTFVLDDGVDVIGAHLADGMLTINLMRTDPRAQPERIEIAE